MDSLLLDIEATFEKYIWSKSNFMSRAQDDTMVKLITNIRYQIQKIEVGPPRANLSQWLRTALKSLREDRKIIVAKADEGDAVVVLNSEHYFGLAAKHLADSQTYELLETDPSAEIVVRYHQYLNRCVNDKVLDIYQYCRLKVSSDYQLPII